MEITKEEIYAEEERKNAKVKEEARLQAIEKGLVEGTREFEIFILKAFKEYIDSKLVFDADTLFNSKPKKKKRIRTGTTISLDEDKMYLLLSWIYGNDKPTDWHKTDLQIVKQLKDACKRLDCEEFIDEFVETKNLVSKEEMMGISDKKQQQERILELTDPNGQFFCPTCKVRTNEKTYKTRCVICDTSLMRGEGL